MKTRLLFLLTFLAVNFGWGQTYYDMSSGNYSQTFTGWSGYATNWNGLAILGTGTIPVATKTTTATNGTLAVNAGSTGIGYDATTSTKLVFLSTGATDNSAAVACDLNLNFASRNAGTLTFDYALIFNTSVTVGRASSLLVYYSIDGTNWTTLSGPHTVYNTTGNSTANQNVSLSLPAALNNQSTVKLRFYEYNGGTLIGSPSGSRPKISLDNVNVTSTPISSNDQTSKIETPTTQVTAGDVASTTTLSGAAVEAFKFKITDAGTADGLATKVTQVKIKKSSGTADWTDHIAGASLWDGATQITTGTVVITDTDITFPITAGNLDIADGSNKEISLKIWLNTTNIVDNATMVFSVPQTSHGFTADTSGSSFATDFGAAVTGNAMTVRVAATKLLLTTQPATTACPNTNITTAPVFKATDTNGMVDADFTSQVTLSNSGSLGMSNYQMNAVAGVATFSTLQFTTTGAVTLTASASGLADSSASNSVTISVANATAAAATNGNTQSVITWTNPSCSDEILIVAKAVSAVATTPSGDGTAYTASLSFGTGTAFDGGFVVYKGTTSSQTIIGLTNGTTYHFTLFTRKGTSWSVGATTTATPVLSSATTDYFRSKATGNWNNTSTWESSSDNTNWINATLTPTSVANIVSIKNGHTVTCTSSISIDQLTIETGATLKNNLSQTFTIADGSDAFDLIVDGTFENAGTVTTNGAAKFNANAVYKNTGNGNTIVRATWDADSFCYITGNTSATAITNIGNQISAYGTLIWNCTGQTNWFEMTGSFDVAKDFQINSTGGSTRGINLVTTSTNRTFNIGGNLELNGAKIALSNNSGRATLNIAGNLILSDSSINQLDMGYDNFNSTGNYRSSIYLSGNLYIGTSATLTCTDNNTHDDYGNIIFEKQGSQTFENKGNLSWIDFDVDSGSTLVLNSILNLGASQTASDYNQFIVQSGGTIDFNGFNITDGNSGEGIFHNYAGSTIKITSPQGISYAGTSGNVLLGYPTFDENANYTYKASGSQNTGDGLPVIVNNLDVINNTNLKLSNATVNLAGIMTIESSSSFDNGGSNQVTGLGTINVTGTFITQDADGFVGATAAVNGPTVTLNAGSTVEYAGTTQTITTTQNYKNLKISAAGTKTIADNVTVEENLTVSAGTLNVNSEKILTVLGQVQNTGGAINFANSASLMQNSATTTNNNTGSITYKRTTSVLNNNLDFVYWGSPVANQTLSGMWMTTANDTFYSFDTAKSGGEDWAYAAPSTIMEAGKGYATRAVSGTGSPVWTPSNSWTANFVGKPNNGDVPFTMVNAGGANIDNLMANPYPSAIDLAIFRNDADNSAKLTGNFYFWTHNTSISSNTYTNNDYAILNVALGASVATSPSGPTPLSLQFVAAGQGFFAEAATAGTVLFKNAHRVAGDNNAFYRQANPAIGFSSDKIWLNLSNANGLFKQQLLAYTQNATIDFDPNYDAKSFEGNADIDFYSIIPNKNLAIQSRPTFTANDVVPIGYKSSISGNFSIAIDHSDGLFAAGQTVYLQDNLLGIDFNLLQGAYNFTTNSGTFNNRFVLKYTSALSTTDDNLSANNVIVVKNSTQLKIKSLIKNISSISVFDLLGRKIIEENNLDTNEFMTTSVPKDQVLIVKITLVDGTKIAKKVN